MAIQTWVQLAGALGITHVTYLIVYRLFLSPLAKIPGPKLAGLTSWYEIYYDMIKPAQYIWKIKEMHEKYGPIVRVAPNEIHVSDPDYLDEIYAGASKNRELYDFQLRVLPVPLSMGAAKTHELHRKRREALNPFFSKRSVGELESMIKAKVNKLVKSFETHRDSGKPVNLSNVYYALANE
jgi:cytochrome P450